jgi:hypothetical protein
MGVLRQKEQELRKVQGDLERTTKQVGEQDADEQAVIYLEGCACDMRGCNPYHPCHADAISEQKAQPC